MRTYREEIESLKNEVIEKYSALMKKENQHLIADATLTKNTGATFVDMSELTKYLSTHSELSKLYTEWQEASNRYSGFLRFVAKNQINIDSSFGVE